MKGGFYTKGEFAERGVSNEMLPDGTSLAQRYICTCGGARVQGPICRLPSAVFPFAVSRLPSVALRGAKMAMRKKRGMPALGIYLHRHRHTRALEDYSPRPKECTRFSLGRGVRDGVQRTARLVIHHAGGHINAKGCVHACAAHWMCCYADVRTYAETKAH